MADYVPSGEAPWTFLISKVIARQVLICSRNCAVAAWKYIDFHDTNLLENIELLVNVLVEDVQGL